MSLGERIREVRKSIAPSQVEFAALLGVSQRTVSNWESGRNEPPMDVLLRFTDDFGINMNWLVTGAGVMRHDDDALAGRSDFTYVSPADGETCVGVKTVWAAGKIAPKPETLRSVVVDDDVMEPFLRSGDVVFADSAQAGLRDGLFVVMLGGGARVRRIQVTGADALRLVCDNPLYPPVDTTAGAVQVVGRVVWVGKRV